MEEEGKNKILIQPWRYFFSLWAASEWSQCTRVGAKSHGARAPGTCGGGSSLGDEAPLMDLKSSNLRVSYASSEVLTEKVSQAMPPSTDMCQMVPVISPVPYSLYRHLKSWRGCSHNRNMI